MYYYYIHHLLQLLYEKETCPFHGTTVWFLILMHAIILCIITIGMMFNNFNLYKIASETVMLIKLFVLDIVRQLGTSVPELWRDFKSIFGDLKDTIIEKWQHLSLDQRECKYHICAFCPDVRHARNPQYNQGHSQRKCYHMGLRVTPKCFCMEFFIQAFE